jgi:GTP-binding protein
MALIDEVQIHISAGGGGDGVVRWRQEKFKPLSGPGGGNGGPGGDVYIQAVSDIGYLDFYRHTKEFQAEHGHPGGNNSRQGATGESLTLKFPVGSILSNRSTGEVFELDHVDQKILILKGGRGGLGNEHFKSSKNVTPRESTPGQPGESADFDVELRMFADIGLVGLPSAGKSTLLNALTNAKSKVAAYHFTTLDPHLGAFYEFIIADIPGIIEGASDGKGLGTKFLKHITRTRAIAHVLDLTSDDLVSDYTTIRTELETHDKELGEKDEIIIFTKSDEVDEKTLKEKLKSATKITKGKTVFVTSMYDDTSIKELSDGLIKYLRK